MSTSAIVKSSTPLFELSATVSDTGEATATLPIGWRPTAELVEQISNDGYRNLHVVLVVRHITTRTMGDVTTDSYRNTKVYVAPITQELQYVDFSSPGRNEVVVLLVNVNSDNARRLDKWRNNTFIYEVDAPPPGGEITYLGYNDITVLYNIRTTLDVYVPREMFGKEPAAWRKRLVKQFFHTQEHDNCHFRKRFIAASVLTLFVQLYGLIVRPLLALLVLFVGYRDVQWKRFFALNPHDLVQDLDDTWWNTTREGDERGISVWWILNPLVLAVISIVSVIPPAIAFAIFSIHTGKRHMVTWGWWKTVCVVDIGFVALAVLVTAAFVFGRFLSEQNKQASRTSIWERRRQARQARLLAELEAMAQRKHPVTDLRELSADKQTVVLKFYDFKTRVCKPFAR